MTQPGIRFIESIAELSRDEWQRLVHDDNPFIGYDYLLELERSGATGPGTGWQSMHLVQRDTAGTLTAAVPLYLKDDSWGEFVFDFAWAEAHHRHGVPYYPKLVSAVPYTPVPGARLLLSDDLGNAEIASVFSAIQQQAVDVNASSWHVLFPQEQQVKLLSDHQLLIRKDCQFHWFNAGYTSFEEYLATFRSARRKNTRRERQRIIKAGVTIKQSKGCEMDAARWHDFYALYASTFYKRGRTPYFSEDFFMGLATAPGIDIVIKWAYVKNRAIAAALFFKTSKTLYGRYWGCSEFVDGLHFELCYYQGIELCIEHRIQCFDPGVQGEHKIARGFQATASWSAHWLRHRPFAEAISDYLVRERQHIDAYMREVDAHLPFRRDHKASSP